MIYTQTKTSYERTESGKSWKKQPYEVTSQIITRRQYDLRTNAETAKAFRRAGSRSERLESSYTFHGYIVTKATTINPSRDNKAVREFKPLGNGITHKITHKRTGRTAYTKTDTETAGEKMHRLVSGSLPDRTVAIPTARAARLGYKVEKLDL